MLFDLRGRGRRRTVKVIYVGLALLFGVGFIGFGVGVGGGGGGLLDALTSNNGTNGASYTAQIKKDRKAIAAQPNNPALLVTLIQDLLRQAGTPENYESSSTTSEGGFKPKAKSLLQEARQEWQRYVQLETKNPSSDLASQMLQVFSGTGGLNEPTAAVAAMQIVIASRPPSEALYASLAELSYRAGNTRQGDLASSKAEALAPATERGLLKLELEKVKKNPKGEASTTTATSSASAGAATSGTAAGGTVTIGGKTYNVAPSTSGGSKTGSTTLKSSTATSTAASKSSTSTSAKH